MPREIVYEGLKMPYGHTLNLYLGCFTYLLISISALLINGNENFFGYAKHKRVVLIILFISSLANLILSIILGSFIKPLILFLVLLLYCYSNYFKKRIKFFFFVPIIYLIYTVINALGDFAVVPLVADVALVILLIAYMNSQESSKPEEYDSFVKMYYEKLNDETETNEEGEVKIYENEEEYIEYLNNAYIEKDKDDEEEYKQYLNEKYDGDEEFSPLEVIEFDIKRVKAATWGLFLVFFVFLFSTLLSLSKVDIYRLSYMNSYYLANGLCEELKVSYMEDGEEYVFHDSRDFNKGTKFQYSYFSFVLNHKARLSFIGPREKSKCIKIQAKDLVTIEVYPFGQNHLLMKYKIDGEVTRSYIINHPYSAFESNLFTVYKK